MNPMDIGEFKRKFGFFTPVHYHEQGKDLENCSLSEIALEVFDDLADDLFSFGERSIAICGKRDMVIEKNKTSTSFPTWLRIILLGTLVVPTVVIIAKAVLSPLRWKKINDLTFREAYLGKIKIKEIFEKNSSCEMLSNRLRATADYILRTDNETKYVQSLQGFRKLNESTLITADNYNEPKSIERGFPEFVNDNEYRMVDQDKKKVLPKPFDQSFSEIDVVKSIIALMKNRKEPYGVQLAVNSTGDDDARLLYRLFDIRVGTSNVKSSSSTGDLIHKILRSMMEKKMIYSYHYSLNGNKLHIHY